MTPYTYDVGIVGKCVGVWGEEGKRCKRRCRKVCWGVGGGGKGRCRRR